MVTVNDFLRLPYDPTLTHAGIEYAKKSLHYTYNRMGLSPAERLRKIVVGVAVELALRRWLTEHQVPYDLLGTTAFTTKDKYDLRLGGRRCDLKSFFISQRQYIRQLRRDPSWLLEAEALVPTDQLSTPALEPQDLYIFGYLAGLDTHHPDDEQRAQAAHQPMCWLHPVSAPQWLGEPTWRSLGRLVCKGDIPAPLMLELGGQDAAHGAIAEYLQLQPRERLVTEKEFYTLLYLQLPQLPLGPVGVRSATLEQRRLVQPNEWFNIWIYGMEVFIVGWLTKNDFRGRSRPLPAGSRTQLYARTQTANHYLPVQALRPMSELVKLVQQG